jgi:hypothetical protein
MAWHNRQERFRLVQREVMWCNGCVAKRFLCVMSVLVWAITSPPQIKGDESRTGWFHVGTGPPRPIVELPDYVPAEPGKLMLWADLAHRKEGRVPLFLVNRTDTSKSLYAQDGDIFVKLEYQGVSGAWVRAQTHRFSDCGNSYDFRRTLAPGQFFAFYGYAPEEGEKQKIRYASYGNDDLVSNEGEGLILQADVYAAAHDDLSAAQIPLAMRDLLEIPKEAGNTDRDRYKTAVAMRLLELMDRNEVALDQVRALKSLLKTKPVAEATSLALSVADEVLAYHWPAKSDRDAIFKRFSGAINADTSHAPAPGTLESQPELIWSLLAESYNWENPSPDSLHRDAAVLKSIWIAAANNILNTSSMNILGATMSMLRNTLVTDQVISTSEFEAWLQCEHSRLPDGRLRLQEVAANALAQRAQWGDLIRIGTSLDPQGQAIVLRALAFTGHDPVLWQDARRYVRSPMNRSEQAFWDLCLNDHPELTLAALWSYEFEGQNHPFARFLHDQVRDYLLHESDRLLKNVTAEDMGPDFQHLRMAVSTLCSDYQAKDLPLLKSLVTRLEAIHNSLALTMRSRIETTLVEHDVDFLFK